LNNQIHTLYEESIDPLFLSGEANKIEVLRILDDKEARFKELETRSLKYNQW
jgi:hypothetical protein